MADGANFALVPKVRDVQAVVCAGAGLELSEMRHDRRRHARVAKPRQEAMYLAREMTGKSYPLLGREFAGKHHTTIYFAVKKMARLIQTDVDLEIRLNRYREAIYERVAARAGGVA